MHAQIDRIIIPQERIAQRVKELARQITADHSASQSPDGEITIVPVLTGAMIFCADLMRQMPMAMRIGLLAISSYPGKSVRAQEPAMLGLQLGDIRGRHILVVDDILDSGGTITLVRSILLSMSPASLKTCVLLRKQRPAAMQVAIDFVGFDIPDEFVVGYGLDYDDYYRNLPDVVTLEQPAPKHT